MSVWKSIIRCAAAAALLSAAATAAAQNFPTKRVTLIVPYAAGGPTDTVARVLGQMMEKTWGQPFLVENRPGAGSLIGTAYVAKADPDGYTLLMNGVGVVSSKFFTKDLGYNPADLKPIVELGDGYYLIVTNPATGFKTLGDLVAFAKKNPGKLNWGPIAFSNQHLDYLAVQRQIGVDITLIPYNSAAESTTAVVRNDLQLQMGVAQPFLPLVKDGKLVALAVTGPARNPKIPNVPTAKEAGFDLNYGFDFGVFVPTKTPQPVVTKIATDIAAAVKSKEYQSRLDTLDYTTLPDPLSWPSVIDAKVKAYDEVVKQIKLQPK
jgi:tripartite-type tricarboxylate transporter receptor subunit TctC